MIVYWELNIENREHWFDIPDDELEGMTEEEKLDYAQDWLDYTEFNNIYCGIVTRLDERKVNA